MKGFIMPTGLRERGPTPQCREPCRRNFQGTDSPKQVGSQERGRAQQQAPLFGVREESTSRRREGVSLLGLNVTRSLSGSGWQEGELVAGPASSPECSWSSGQDAHSLLVGLSKRQKNRFLQFIVWCCLDPHPVY